MENKLWIFAFQQSLEEHQIIDLKKHLDAFLGQWKAHNISLKASYDLYYRQFLKIEVDQSFEKASGCSIDAMKKFVHQWVNEQKIEVATPWMVFYLDNELVKSCLTQDLKQKFQDGEITEQTTVLMNNIITSKDFQTDWKVALAHSPYQQFL